MESRFRHSERDGRYLIEKLNRRGDVIAICSLKVAPADTRLAELEFIEWLAELDKHRETYFYVAYA